MQRFTISLDDPLAEAFDALIVRRGYANRSEAVRDLLRAELQRADLAERPQTHCVACLSYVYNHHERDLAERVTRMQHEQHDLTVSTMHAHLDHDHCLETVLLRGPTEAVRGFADRLCAERGVHHGHLNLIAVDLHDPHRHAPDPSPAAGVAASPSRRPASDPTRRSTGAGRHVHLRPRR